ncbi:antibiotic biosynthesis monooxygenase [bacterium]|nr:MAG: antibiotic biosynthesis monooxygenase [bacterium]RKZ16343.1 MAG: antibiotic biosynthesis monooxygenase [bacterium]
MSNALTWIVLMSVRDGELDNARTLMREMVESTQAEPGTLAYEWFLTEDSSTCHLYERYADSDAAMVHIGTFGQKYAERFMGCFEPTNVHVYGEPSAEARTALDEFDATYFGTFGGFFR